MQLKVVVQGSQMGITHTWTLRLTAALAVYAAACPAPATHLVDPFPLLTISSNLPLFTTSEGQYVCVSTHREAHGALDNP
jgi:hypothetical protein